MAINSASHGAATLRGGRLEAVASVLAPQFVALVPALVFLDFNNYSAFRAESLIFIGGLALAALFFGVATMKMRPWIRVVAYALIITLFLDIQFAWVDINTPSILVVLIGLLVAVLPLRLHIATVVATVFGTILFLLLGMKLVPESSDIVVATSPVAVEEPQSAQPAIIHLVLDEHIGIEGIPENLPGGPAVKAALRQFFLENGFRLYGKAYSEYFLTTQSLAQMLNFRSEYDHRLVTHIGRRSVRHQIGSNAYFAGLRRKGYRLHVYQSDFLDFCTGSEISVDSCRIYPAVKLGAIREAPIPAIGKARVVASLFTKLSSVYVFLRRIYHSYYTVAQSRGWNLPAWDWERVHLTSIGAMPMFAQLRSDLSRGGPGEAYFAHLLAPHHPYAYGAGCELLNPDQWASRTMAHASAAVSNSPATRRSAYERYLPQLLCLKRQLAAILETIAENAKLDDAVILVHGDHGSRITIFDPVRSRYEQLGPTDYTDSFSTLFAVRAPDIPSGYDLRLSSIQTLFADLYDGGFRSTASSTANATEAPTIHIFDYGRWLTEYDAALFRAPMPDFGVAEVLSSPRGTSVGDVTDDRSDRTTPGAGPCPKQSRNGQCGRGP